MTGEASGSPLADIPPAPAGVLLVGLNPVPESVAAGHYHQGEAGRRLWKRLERLGLLADPEPGVEDVAFARLGHGVTDIVKRPARWYGDASAEERIHGVSALRENIARWRPSLVLFASEKAARAVCNGLWLGPGRGEPIGDIPTLLLPSSWVRPNEAAEVDRQLAELLENVSIDAPEDKISLTHLMTAADIAAGRVRAPGSSKHLFPAAPGALRLVLRGQRFAAHYDPRLTFGTSGDCHVSVPVDDIAAILMATPEYPALSASELADLVRPDEYLRISHSRGGVVKLD